MTKKLIYLLAVIAALDTVTVLAQGTAKPAEGSMTLSKKNYQLTQGIAYESSATGDELVVVVLSAQPLAGEKLKRALATERSGGFGEFPQPYLKMYFKKTGELQNWSALGGGTTVGGASDGTGELKLENGRVTGKANAAVQADALIPKGFDVRFDVAMLKAGEAPPASTAKKGGPAANVKPTVTGTFTGNGKEAKLAYVSARWSEPFDGKPGITLVFSEKDQGKEKKPEDAAMFGKFGNALIISLHDDGSIYSCQVVHNALKNKGFSSSGSIEATPFAYEDGKVEGEITTNGPVDTFDEKWEVKLKFVAPLGEIPKEYQVEEKKEEKTAAKESDEDKSDEEAVGRKPNEKGGHSEGAGFKGKDVALTKDAADVDYKGLVGQIDFQSKLSVKSACAELTANLKAQGWTKDGDDLLTPNSSILNRKRGSAKLTIFVKPDGGGSHVRMMTDGLVWDED